MTQLDLNLDPEIVDRRAAELVTILSERGWMTRRQIKELTGWEERYIRAAAAAATDKKGLPLIVRGQLGFSTVERANSDEIRDAAEDAISQAKKMIAYAIGLRRLLHKRIG
jgi:hypothetical protein